MVRTLTLALLLTGCHELHPLLPAKDAAVESDMTSPPDEDAAGPADAAPDAVSAQPDGAPADMALEIDAAVAPDPDAAADMGVPVCFDDVVDLCAGDEAACACVDLFSASTGEACDLPAEWLGPGAAPRPTAGGLLWDTTEGDPASIGMWPLEQDLSAGVDLRFSVTVDLGGPQMVPYFTAGLRVDGKAVAVVFDGGAAAIPNPAAMGPLVNVLEAPGSTLDLRVVVSAPDEGDARTVQLFNGDSAAGDPADLSIFPSTAFPNAPAEGDYVWFGVQDARTGTALLGGVRVRCAE